MHPGAVAAPLAPPDGGFGWIVALGSFLVHVVADGVCYAYGVFIPTLLDEFNEGETITVSVGSTLFGVTLVVGPIVTVLVNRYGCRPVTCVGALVATVGIVASSFSTNMTFMLLTLGVLTGFGFGLIYLPAIVSVTQWFEKKRAFATGIAVCGSGVGMLAFAPLFRVLINEYSWNGALLILAGIVFNCAVFGALFRPVEYEAVAVIAQNDEDSPEEEVSEHQKNIRVVSTGSNKDLQVDRDELGFAAHSDTDIHVQDNRRRHISSEGENSAVSVVTVPPMARKDALYTGSLSSIPLYRYEPDRYRASVLDLSRTQEDASLREDRIPAKKTGWVKMTSALAKELLDPTLFSDWVFLYFTLSNFLTNLAFQVPLLFLVDRAEKELHIENAEYILSAVGAGNIAGRIGFGLLADRPEANKLWLYNVTVTLAGLSVVTLYWCETLLTNVICAGLFGIFIGAFVSLTPVIVVDLFGLERLTNAFGNLLLFQGFSAFLGPPAAAALKESSGDYSSSFVAFGVIMAVSGAMLFFTPCLRTLETSWRGRRRYGDQFSEPAAQVRHRKAKEVLPLMELAEKGAVASDL